MIVCSCNVLTDHDIRIVVTASREQPLIALQVYGCLGCSIRCGRCARAIKRIITEASIACAEGCAYCSAVRGVRLRVFRRPCEDNHRKTSLS